MIRERSEFDKHVRQGTSLDRYINTLVSYEAYGAALAINELIPEKKVVAQERFGGPQLTGSSDFPTQKQ